MTQTVPNPGLLPTRRGYRTSGHPKLADGWTFERYTKGSRTTGWTGHGPQGQEVRALTLKSTLVRAWGKGELPDAEYPQKRARR